MRILQIQGLRALAALLVTIFHARLLPGGFIGVDSHSKELTGIQLWAHICAHLNFELRDCLITFPIFVPSQRLIARNVRELFSFNRGVSHLNEACRIDDRPLP